MDMLKVVENWNNKDGDGTEEEFEYCEKHLEVVETSEDAKGKHVVYSTIYKDNNTGKYYKAYNVRTNTGYWGDSEREGSGCYEVVPREITKTIYVVVK